MFSGKTDPGEVIRLIRSGKISLAGNQKLKIYGTLHCASGKRMRKKMRVFFTSEKEALKAGFRPCSHCLRQKYVQWKQNASITGNAALIQQETG